jgi:histidinol-phosphate/aromatic aminotransferase/cobyric acid decarboxylase-like protein
MTEGGWESIRRILDRYAPGGTVLAVRSGAEDWADHRVTTVDYEATAPWPAETVDAAVCPRWRGQGREADDRRLLRRVHRHLRAGGVLVVDHAPGDEQVAPDGSGFDPVTGTFAGPRRYAPTQLVALVRGAGFAVEAVEVGPAPGHAVRVVARPVPAPPGALAVASWGTPADVRLDLRYAPDEAPWLDPSPDAIWEELIGSVRRSGAELVAGYPVDDPYGGERGAEVVGRFFGITVAPGQLTFAAGVTSLLHDLCDLADGGPILAPALVHPDLEAWALSRGAVVRTVPEPAGARELVDALRATRPALLHLDRPVFTGQLLALDELAEVARAAAAVGAPVVVDESPAPYLGPAGSAAQLLETVDNLVVLRGFTKAYSWGGLRGGFALASPGLAGRVRELVVPMQVGELALAAALRLLAAGDVFGQLRRRVRAVKPAFAKRLADAGLVPVDGHPDVPWVVVEDRDGAASRLLAARGIRGLAPAPMPVVPPPTGDLLHLAVPLSDERMALFDRLMAASLQAAR